MDLTSSGEWSTRPISRRNSRQRSGISKQYQKALINVAKPMVALAAIIGMLGLGEFYFRYIHLEPDGFFMTMMGQRWYQECWNPIFTLENPAFPEDGTLKLRDRAWTAADLVGKRKVMIVGDSFAAGHGLCDVDQRFGNQLGQQLGADYAVMNMAHNGWNTSEELFFVPHYPFDPDVVVLSYYINDVMSAVPADTNFAVPSLYKRPVDDLTAQLVNRSYLADYIYWHILVQRQWAASGEDVTAAYLAAYDDEKIWARQQQQLQQFIDWTRSKNAKLVVVAWPILYDVEASRHAITKVSSVFQSQDIPVINAADLFAGSTTSELIISNIDAHPSLFAHTEVANALYDAIKALPQ